MFGFRKPWNTVKRFRKRSRKPYKAVTLLQESRRTFSGTGPTVIVVFATAPSDGTAPCTTLAPERNLRGALSRTEMLLLGISWCIEKCFLRWFVVY